MRAAAVAAALIVLAGCDSGGNAAGRDAANRSPRATSTPAPPLSPTPEPPYAAASASAAPVPGSARSVEVRTDLFTFAYAYPAAAGSIGKLRAALDAEIDKARGALERSARAGADSARRAGFPYHAYEEDKTWRVAAEPPGWLSLSARIYSYSGGAHGMAGFDSLVWDKRFEVRRDPSDLFTTRAALRAAVKPAFCAALDRERARRRQGRPIGDAVPEFSRCIDPTEATLVLGSTDGRAFDRIGFLIEPYAAGPYVEGTYEIALPVTPAVLATVKPQYQQAFAAP